MQNRCWKKACKKYGKLCQNASNMGAKIQPKSEKYRKKRHPKIDAEIWCQKNAFFSRAADFHGFWIGFLAVPGGRGAVDTWKYRIDSNSLTRSPPRWGAADQNGAQNQSRINEKSRLRLRRGCVFGAFWGAKKLPTSKFPRTILATIFAQKSKNGIQKGIQKSMPKKYRTMMPKWCQNGFQNQCFFILFRKGEKPRNY